MMVDGQGAQETHPSREPDGPSLSVVLVTPDTYDTIRATVEALRRQTARRHLELLIVAPAGNDLGPDATAAGDFLVLRVVELDAFGTQGAALAAGVRAARAPVVVLAEDHAFPAPDWAETLIAAHRGPWSAVGPAIVNANPESMISWAEFLFSFGAFRAPLPSGVVERLPTHNSSYKRAVLLEYGDALDAMLEAESVLLQDLRARGHRFYLAGTTTVAHLNFERPWAFIWARWYAGRLFAATRSQGWSLPRRLLYVVAAPLIPMVGLGRIARELRRPPRPPLRVLPALLLGLVVNAAGECLGYAVGAGPTAEKVSGFERHRVRYLRKRRVGRPVI